MDKWLMIKTFATRTIDSIGKCCLNRRIRRFSHSSWCNIALHKININLIRCFMVSNLSVFVKIVLLRHSVNKTQFAVHSSSDSIYCSAFSKVDRCIWVNYYSTIYRCKYLIDYWFITIHTNINYVGYIGLVTVVSSNASFEIFFVLGTPFGILLNEFQDSCVTFGIVIITFSDWVLLSSF